MATSRKPSGTHPVTLCIDVGGTGLKALTLDAHGEPTTERQRVETPHPATPEAVLATLEQLIRPLPRFDRVSVGFPGVVVEGRVKTAPNLDPSWSDFDLERAIERLTGKDARVLNDAGVQGLGVIEGHGVEMVITLGTGMGCGLYVGGRYVPNLELAHHPFRKGKTYEEWVGEKARKKVGNKRWNRRVEQVIAQLEPIWNYRKLYIGGGNAKRIRFEPPANVQIVDNVAGLLGGIRLWEHDAPRERSGRVAKKISAA